MKKSLSIAYEEYEHYSELNDSDKRLLEKANEIVKDAYAPYSKFKVGAAVLLENGEIVLGSNQENIAYPSGLCAERVALFYVGANFPDVKVDTICIVAKGDLIPHDYLLSPCGACRQVMNETEMRQKQSYRVILLSQNDRVLVFNSAVDLLPFAFGK
jgi:cytidine deaminase